VIKESMHGRVRVTLLATARTEAIQESPAPIEHSFEKRKLETPEVGRKRRGISFLDHLTENKDDPFFKLSEGEELLKASGDYR